MSRNTVLIVAMLSVLVAGCDLFASSGDLTQRAQASIAENDYARAGIELRNALKKDPDNAEARVLLAKTLLWQGDVQGAEQEIDKAKAAGGQAAGFATVNADVLRRLGKFTELQKAMEAKPAGMTEPERQLYLGYALIGQGHPAEAQQAFQAAASNGQGDTAVRARTALAELLATAGDTTQALAAFDETLKQSPGAPGALLGKARLLISLGERQAAIDTLQAMNLADPKSPLSVFERMAGLSMIAETQLALNQPKDAAKTVAALAQVAPRSVAVNYLSGRIDIAEGRPDAAVTEFQKVVQAAPTFVPGRLALAGAQLQQGNLALAEAELQAALQTQPDSVEARKLLAQVQIRQGRGADAADVLAPALESGGNDASLYTLAGQAEFLSGNSQAGEQLFERGIEAAAQDDKGRLDVAASYLAAGDSKRALEVLATVPDEQGGERKRQIQLLALASGKDKAVARAEVDALLKRNPGDVRLLNLAAGWFATQGDLAAARSALEQARKADPKDGATLVNLGRLDFKEKRYDDARGHFEAAVKLDPKSGQAYLGLAVLADRVGDRAGAMRWLDTWSKADPAAFQPRLLLARVAFADKDAERGRALVAEAVKAGGAKPQVLAVAGQVLFEARQFDEALVEFRKAADADPRNANYLLGAARAQVALKQNEAARGTLNQALAVDPKLLVAVSMLAQLDIADGKPDDALARANALTKSPATAATGYALKGDVYAGTRQPAMAAEAYSQAYKLRPSQVLAIAEFTAREKAGIADPQQPLLAWLKASPKDDAARLVLAQYYDGQRQSDAAIREYQAILGNQPENVLVLNNLAWLYQVKGDPRALELARRAYEAAPKSAAIADTYGWILLQQGDAKQALKLLKQAHDLDGKNAEIEYHLGVALVKNGDSAEGRQHIEAAIAAGGSAPWVAAAKEALGQ